MTWDDLVAGALVGTARRPPAIPDSVSPGVDEVLRGIDRDDPEGALLQAGAVLGLYRQAGVRLPVDEEPAPAPSPPETRGYVSPAATERLDAILGGGYRSVLGEWLGRVAGAGLLVPADRLPALLHVASVDHRVRAVTADVIGERGRWLGGLNPAWSWAAGAGEDVAGTWSTGERQARRLLLARLRAEEPAAARELLASTWATETPEDRAAFVAILAAGLSMDDEPFLEAALDDRRKEVRQAATGQLVRLPESRLAARMAERSRPLVQEGRLPDEVDAGMARDGIVAKPPAGVGARAWWLHQVVAATPLATWPPALGGSPADLAGRAGAPLRRAWAAAAALQGDGKWAGALLDAGVEEPALLAAVAHERAVAHVTARIAAGGLAPAVLDFLDHCPDPWGPALSRRVVDALGELVKRPARPEPRLAGLAARLDPSVAPVATDALSEHAGRWSDVVGWFLDLLTFRAEMYEELPVTGPGGRSCQHLLLHHRAMVEL